MSDEPPIHSSPGPDQVARRRPSVRISRRNIWIAVAAGLGLLLLGVVLVVAVLPRLLSTPTQTVPVADTPVAVAGDARRIQATLFYVADNGSELVPVSRQVLYGATPLEQARRIVEAQVEPPPDGHAPAIPAGTTVRAVFLAADGNAYVDLGGAIVTRPFGRLAQRSARRSTPSSTPSRSTCRTSRPCRFSSTARKSIRWPATSISGIPWARPSSGSGKDSSFV